MHRHQRSETSRRAVDSHLQPRRTWRSCGRQRPRRPAAARTRRRTTLSPSGCAVTPWRCCFHEPHCHARRQPVCKSSCGWQSNRWKASAMRFCSHKLWKGSARQQSTGNMCCRAGDGPAAAAHCTPRGAAAAWRSGRRSPARRQQPAQQMPQACRAIDAAVDVILHSSIPARSIDTVRSSLVMPYQRTFPIAGIQSQLWR